MHHAVLASSNFLIPNATFIVELVAFLLILGFLAKYVLPPLNKAVATRQETIRLGLAEAEAGRELRRQADAERQRILDEAREQARAVIDQATRIGETVREELTQRGHEEYERILAGARLEIERATQRAAQELRAQVVDLVIETASRVIGAELDDAAHRRLVEETILAVDSRA